jgi:predicted amidophosphoribosyltransferase
VLHVEAEGLSGLEPAPAGFPACARCPYRALARPDVCLACMTASQAQLALLDVTACPVCEQVLGPDGRCRNEWCDRVDRWWSTVWAIGLHVGPLKRAVAGYKYRGETGWSAVFGRLLLGYLDEHMPWFDDYDVLVPMPAYTDAGARRRWDPVGRIVAVAEDLAGPRWPVERDLIVKTAETPPMTGLGLGRRRARAEGDLRRALRVPDRERVGGARVLVVDDVFTEGSTLREVARALAAAGATEVAGLVLARQPWLPPGHPPGPRPSGPRPSGPPPLGMAARTGE